MPAPRPFIGESDLHLIGLILDDFHDLIMEQGDYSPTERVRAMALFEDLDVYLTEKHGREWNRKDVAG